MIQLAPDIYMDYRRAVACGLILGFAIAVFLPRGVGIFLAAFVAFILW